MEFHQFAQTRKDIFHEWYYSGMVMRGGGGGALAYQIILNKNILKHCEKST